MLTEVTKLKPTKENILKSIKNFVSFIKNNNIGTTSAAEGFFNLEGIPELDFELSFNIIGYQDTTISIISKEKEISALGFEYKF